MSTRLILGSLEPVSLPRFGVSDVLAKVDTGAFSGALHCTDITVERHGEQERLFFSPLGDDSLRTSVTDFKEIIVRSANGQESIRYVLPVIVEVQGQEYETVIGLSDRTVMRREMLLGRRFLLENEALVDVSLTKDIDIEAERIEEDDL